MGLSGFNFMVASNTVLTAVRTIYSGWLKNFRAYHRRGK